MRPLCERRLPHTVAFWHLWLNRKPLLALLKHGDQRRRQARTLFVLFTLAVVTALLAWITGKLFDGNLVERGLVEVHDNLVIPMAILMVMHIWQRRARSAGHLLADSGFSACGSG